MKNRCQQCFCRLQTKMKIECLTKLMLKRYLFSFPLLNRINLDVMQKTFIITRLKWFNFIFSAYARCPSISATLLVASVINFAHRFETDFYLTLKSHLEEETENRKFNLSSIYFVWILLFGISFGKFYWDKDDKRKISLRG